MRNKEKERETENDRERHRLTRRNVMDIEARIHTYPHTNTDREGQREPERDEKMLHKDFIKSFNGWLGHSYGHLLYFHHSLSFRCERTRQKLDDESPDGRVDILVPVS